jgi:ATP-dependent DNA helicase RecQ
MHDHDRCDAAPERRALDECFEAEAYLESVGYPRWRSQAQKEIVWATLNTPPGATRVFVLPTGSGKSLCYQLLPRFFAGLTVVVVPTIALAMDQQQNACARLIDLPGVNPVYFASDDNAEATAKAVKERRTRLLFTSPEACVSGRLRPILDQFAADGWLANLVVDEAHLIETWGAQFRVEFQLLASARRRWCRASGNRIRTLLFSATMTSRCQDTLQSMFSDGNAPFKFVCQRLRPEIRYYARPFDSQDERDAAVIDALWHLPRPAILYVTEKAAAESFASTLRSEGFLRLGCFHGDTGKKDRRELLCRWKSNELDLMVATSAFGVGVDKPDVRAVVHACYPENLDRYYQEVGRGGRDGWSSVSLLLPNQRDSEVACSIAVRLMTPELIQQRWSAMLALAEERGEYVYALPVAARHMNLIGTRTYRENIRWNKRLLLQLERALLLDLLDLELRDAPVADDDPEEWAVVRVKFPPGTPKIGELITPQREEELAHFRNGFEKLNGLLSGQKCASRVIGDLYNFASHQRACPGCSYCRARNRQPLPCEPLDFPEALPHPLNAPSELIEACPSPLTPSTRSDFIDLISRCAHDKKLRQYFCPTETFASVLTCFKDAFPANAPTLNRVDSLSVLSKVSSAASFPLTFLHISSVSSQALALARPFPAVHLLCGVPNPTDPNGRHIAVNQGLRIWTSPEAWVAETPESSLPCLPTTL